MLTIHHHHHHLYLYCTILDAILYTVLYCTVLYSPIIHLPTQPTLIYLLIILSSANSPIILSSTNSLIIHLPTHSSFSHLPTHLSFSLSLTHSCAGPIAYIPRNDSFVTMNHACQVECYRYQVLASSQTDIGR